MITGILITNKTYGRDKKGRLLYLCIADLPKHNQNGRLLNYLVPFNNPNLSGFNKAITNYYVTFCHLTEFSNGYPLGQLMDCLGPVDSWEAYSKFELFKRNLYFSNAVSNAGVTFKTFEKQVANLAPVTGIPEPYNIISIDPAGCTDIDDAFAFFYKGSTAHLQIHIANVPAFMETYGLWDDLTTRVTTVYMPTGKVPMLPRHISENVCSLLEGTTRATIMITYIFEIDKETGKIKGLLQTIAPKATFAYVEKNYTYNDVVPNQNALFDAARILKPDYPVNNTHDLIAVFMMIFNEECAEFVPIYRNCVEVQSDAGSAWFNYELQLFTASYDVVNQGHVTIGQAYTHITSPIRRMVDLVNMTAIVYGETHPFVQKWIANIDHINYYCKQARKAQQNAELYKALSENEHMDVVYTGVHIKGSGVVYLQELRLFVFVGKQELPEGTHKYRIYMFHKEFTLKRKIRIMNI